MRFRGHKQKPEKKNLTCSECRANNCKACVNGIMMILGKKMVCECDRDNHHLELEKRTDPRNKQILDPETGSVFTEHMEVKKDGTVKYGTDPFGRDETSQP